MSSGTSTTQEDTLHKHPHDILLSRAKQWNCHFTDQEFARRMDACDPLKHLRDDFHIPTNKTIPLAEPELVDDPEGDSVYLCGNSLGLQPKGARYYIDEELKKWAETGVHGHFMGSMPWALADEVIQAQAASVVGAKTEEVAVMNGLTVNQHILLLSFYQPTSTRHKILLESRAFPSDHYAFESQIRLRGYDPDTSMICMEPREGEELLRLEDILDVIDKEGDSIAVVMFSGVQYYTGQLFDMPTIVKAGHAKGCFVAFDLAHAAGNVEIHLHDWDVDFACWCTYKYMNSGAGGIAGAFIHEKHAYNNFPKLHGWWSHKMDTRFKMTNKLDVSPGIAGYRISNPPPLLCAPLRASLDVFGKTTMTDLRSKSKLLTGYLELMIKHYYPKFRDGVLSGKPYVDIITPADPNRRGCQLSCQFSVPITKVYVELKKRGVALDRREPNVLRLAPTPLYNKFEDVWRFTHLLGDAMHAAKLDI